MAEKGPSRPVAHVVVGALSVRVSDDFPGNYAFTMHGTGIAVVTPDGDRLWRKEVWQRGTWFPVRPFYDRRVKRALRRAQRVADAFGKGSSDGS